MSYQWLDVAQTTLRGPSGEGIPADAGNKDYQTYLRSGEKADKADKPDLPLVDSTDSVSLKKLAKALIQKGVVTLADLV